MATTGKFHSQLLSMHIRRISYLDMSLSRQHSTFGGQYFCFAYAYVMLTVNRTLVGIAALAFTHYRVCHEFWSTERICSSRTYYFLFAIECSLVALMGYTYYLKMRYGG